METSMKTAAYAKKLRARRAELAKRQAAAVKRYKAAFAAWKRDLAAWLKANGADRCASILQSDVSGYRYGSSGWAERVLHGAPKPPAKPSDKTIQKIDGLLRHLAITGQATVRVHSSDIEELFVDQKEGEDE